MSSSDNNADGSLVVGIDFGTTFTGVAYGYGDNPPEPITLWPVAHHGEIESDTAKVPSRLAYSKKRTFLSKPVVTSWGQQAFNDKKAISWFKLLLLEKNDLPTHLENSGHLAMARKLLNETRESVITIIADYLSEVWKHVVDRIEKSRSQQFARTHPYHIVVTVPAIWQDYAIKKMEMALHQAGILAPRPQAGPTTWSFISEPEAAAIAAIEGHNKYETLRVGQTFVIADLGGGTVDLISFKVGAIKPRLLLDEVVEGEGGLCGATFLDQAFETYLEKKLRGFKVGKVSVTPWLEMHELDRQRIMNTWEKGLKRSYYDGHPGLRIDLGTQGKLRPEVFLEPAELNEVFDSVYLDIEKLIKGQTNAILKKTRRVPEFIVLTGGFGRCPYVFQKLQELYGGAATEVLSEENNKPWTAVSRGAVISGLRRTLNQATVRSHVSRYSYGWAKEEDFDHRIHDFADFCENDITGRPVARGQMEWIIRRGESIDTQKPRVYEYERWFDMDDFGIIEFAEPIFRSKLKSPPSRLAENIKEEDEPDSSDFKEYVTIEMKTPVPVEKLLKRGKGDYVHRVLDYRVEVNISGASLVIKAISQDEQIGETTITGLSNETDGD
ncbi:hypothetical protein GGS20DRAFT_596836 [Poronia punctata]|nr:hypothetical protein GGS20DRAFT_596836 [Poronia punctata]